MSIFIYVYQIMFILLTTIFQSCDLTHSISSDPSHALNIRVNDDQPHLQVDIIDIFIFEWN